MEKDKRSKITEMFTSLIDAWDRNDAEAYAAHFTDNATYITYIGTCYRGRRDIVESHRVLFNKFLKDTRLISEINDIRFFGLDTAVVTGRGDTYKGKQPQKLSKVQTYTMVREDDGKWRIAAFHNTKRKPLMEAISFNLARGTIPAEK